jgi:hypothetical protein
MNGSPYEAPTIGIGRLIKEGNRYRVPHHQRDYSWTEDEIDQLITDILEAIKGNQSEYFIGLMVFMPDKPREYRILDGQQRLATTLILLASIRSWLNVRGFDRDTNQIQEHYIAVRELGSDVEEPRLVLNENNNVYFEKYIVKETPNINIENELKNLRRYDPSRRLIQAILFCRMKVEELALEGQISDDEAADRLFNIVRYINDNVKVVRLSVSSEADAYTVFETLNDRGLDLTVLDLVKNYIFGRARNEDNLRDIKSQWMQMMTTLANVPADDFLKVWWTSRYGRVQTAQLFPKFKDKAGTWSKVKSISNDMLTASENYAALEVADDPVWIGLSVNGRERIRSLKLLGGKQVHPVLLSAIQKFSTSELEKLLKLLEVLIVRYQLIGGGRTGRLEITSASLASQIWEGKVRTSIDAQRMLKEIMPSDQDFHEAFRTKQERNNQKASWVLWKLESQARQSSKQEYASELMPGTSLTLEHILPKNPGAEWKVVFNAESAIAEDYIFRLGNMCLLTQVNRKLGNKKFSEKRSYYSKSELLLTKHVADNKVWDSQAIQNRQNQLAKLAVAIWRAD